MRIRLAYDHVAAVRIDFAALVAGHDARRNAGRPQQHDERACIVLTKSAARLEQELIDRLAFEQWCRQRINERLVAVELKHCVDERGVIRNLGAKVAREFDAAPIARRQPKICAGFER